ncbi:hypothetical protein [Acinetobacter sp. Ag2]
MSKNKPKRGNNLIIGRELSKMHCMGCFSYDHDKLPELDDALSTLNYIL